MPTSPFNARRRCYHEELDENDDSDDRFIEETMAERMERLDKWRAERIKNLMERYDCDANDAQRFIDLREEGHSTYQAAVMAGLSDPSY